MRERSLDEFEAVFERAWIPVLDIQEIALKRVAVVLKGDPLDASLLDLARYFHRRFNAQCQAYWPHAGDLEESLAAARSADIVPTERPFSSTAELVGQVSIGRNQLLVVPEPEQTDRRVLDLDPLVQGTAAPVLLVRRPITRADDVFRRILHSLTGNFRQTENFAYSFTLVTDDGELLLLHTIDETDLADVRAALHLSPNVPADGRAELLEGLTRQGERYLKAVVAASRKYPYRVSYRLELGEVVPTVRRELAARPYTLLVVGCHRGRHSFIEAPDYQLMHEIRDIPVLAL